MIVALSELKINVGKYINHAKNQDVYITRNGKLVAKIIGIKRDRVADMKSLFNIANLPNEYENPNYDPDYENLRNERAGI